MNGDNSNDVPPPGWKPDWMIQSDDEKRESMDAYMMEQGQPDLAEHKERTVSNSNTERTRLQRIIQRASRDLKALEERERSDWYSIDEPRIGEVVTFVKRFTGSKRYHYAAIHTDRGWAVTGRTTMTRLNWRQVLQFVIVDEGNPELAKKSLHIATEWLRVVPGYSRHDIEARRARAEDDGPNYEDDDSLNYGDPYDNDYGDGAL